MWTLDDRISYRLAATDFPRWREKVISVGGCARPITLHGKTQIRDTATGSLLHSFSGAVFTPCGNRRESVCPTCSARYAGDAFHVVRAGLIGGTTTVPESVADRPRAFVTLTAPSFGPVHSNPGYSTRGRRIPCRCGEYHHEGDTRLGAPIDPDTYDYTAALLWQGNATAL